MTLSAIPGGAGSPPEPDWAGTFNDVLDIVFAHEQWAALTGEMSGLGTLSVTNGHAIKRLVEFRVQYERAARHVAENGAILPAKRAKVGQFNPYWSIMRQSDEAIRVLEAELGVAPVRRAKAAKVEKKTRQARPADAYLKPVAR